MVIQDEDPFMTRTKTQFVFSANHTERNLTTDFPLFNCKCFSIGRVQRASHCGHWDLLSFSYITRATNNIDHFVSQIYFAQLQSVCIWMGLDRGDLANENPFEPPGNIFDMLHTFDLQTSRCQNLRGPFNGNVKRKQLLNPTGRNLHGTCGLMAICTLANLL